jgi:hypothetical protein
MKNYLLLTLISLFFCNVNAQSNISMYNLRDYNIHSQNQSAIINPKNNVSFGLPLNLEYKASTFFSFKDVLVENPNTGNLKIDLNNLYANSSDVNNTNVLLNINIFNLTIKTKKGGFSIFSNVRHNSLLTLSDSFTYLLANGLDKDLSLENEYLKSSLYNEYGAGYTHRFLEDKLHIGLRVKYLHGIAHAETQKNASLGLKIDNNLNWNFSAQNAVLNTAGATDDEFDVSKSFQNSGLGFDIAARYDYSEKFTFELAVNDIGSIKWKNNVKNYTIDDLAIENGFYEGINLEGDLENVEDELIDYFEETFVMSEKSDEFKTNLLTSSYLSASYLPKENHRLSLIYNSIFISENYTSTLGLGYNLIGKKNTVGLTLSQGGLHNNTNLGVNALASLGFFQIYFATDSILEVFKPIEEVKYIQFNFGMNLLFGRNKAKLDLEE